MQLPWLIQWHWDLWKPLWGEPSFPAASQLPRQWVQTEVPCGADLIG